VVIIITFLRPFPLRVKKDHLPRPSGSSPLLVILETQLLHMTTVPPAWYWNKKLLEIWSWSKKSFAMSDAIRM
jgi:hypothetical protein